MFFIALLLIFAICRDINDPEHPVTLEQLNVVEEELISIEKDNGILVVEVVSCFLLFCINFFNFYFFSLFFLESFKKY